MRPLDRLRGQRYPHACMNACHAKFGTSPSVLRRPAATGLVQLSSRYPNVGARQPGCPGSQAILTKPHLFHICRQLGVQSHGQGSKQHLQQATAARCMGALRCVNKRRNQGKKIETAAEQGMPGAMPAAVFGKFTKQRHGTAQSTLSSLLQMLQAANFSWMCSVCTAAAHNKHTSTHRRRCLRGCSYSVTLSQTVQHSSTGAAAQPGSTVQSSVHLSTCRQHPRRPPARIQPPGVSCCHGPAWQCRKHTRY